MKVELQPSKVRRLLLAGVVLAATTILAAAACGGGGDDELLVFAAASLTDALTELSEDYRAETGTTVLFSFGGSQFLARQIVEGAPADVMISAGRRPIDLMVLEGAVSGATFDLLSNELVVVTRRDHDDPPDDLEDLLSESFDSISVPDPALAPAGVYAKETLTSLGLWEALSDKVIPTPDVRAALTNVERGNTDTALVYRTDAMSGEGLAVFDIVPADSHSAIIYPAAVIASSDRPGEARRFAEFLAGPEAQRVFARFGFSNVSAARDR